MSRRERREIGAAMGRARSYGDWRVYAARLDRLEGNDAWRDDPSSRWYDAELMREHIERLQRLRDAGEVPALIGALEESLYRHQGDIAAPELYRQTHTGETKRLVVEYLDEACAAIEWLAGLPLPAAEKIRRFERAARNYGGSCLMLSGGATWGLYHVGVVRALHREGLLPSVLCGSSMGAVCAASVGTRTDAELAALLDDLGQVHTRPLRRMKASGAARRKALMDPAQLHEHIRANVGDLTFAEAHARSGRSLNISVSPTRARQKPRVLSHLTSPDVLVWSAAAASCAVPGLFPPARLLARDAAGRVTRYAPDERWVDGSMYGDLPKGRVGRLHNVNHFIVSQTNPHVVPFLSNKTQPGLMRFGLHVGGAMVRAQARTALDLTRRQVHGDLARPLLDQLHGLAGQDYEGDINIHPRFDALMYRRVLTNVTTRQLEEFAEGGAQAAWPHLEQVRQTTRVARALDRVLRVLRG